MKMNAFLFCTTALVAAFALTGCASDPASAGEQVEQGGPTAQESAPPTAPAVSKSTGAPNAAPDRGQLLGTIMASAETEKSTGISVWVTYKRAGQLSTVGYAKDGSTKTELTVQRVASSSDIEVASPAKGSLRIQADGTIVSNTLVADRSALAAMHGDFDARSKDAAYGWVAWVLTFVSCAAAGFEGGLNPAANYFCIAGAIDLMNE